MDKRLWRKFVRMLFVGGAVLALVGGSGVALAGDDAQQKAILERLDRLERENQQLKAAIGATAVDDTGIKPAPDKNLPPIDPKAVEKIIGDYMKKQDEEKKAKDAEAKAKAEAEGFKVGTSLGLSTRWNPLGGVTFETPNKDFISHLGVRFQLDMVGFGQNEGLKGPAQLGSLQNGTFFRRIRPSWDGQAWEIMEWNVELALEQIQNDVIDMDEVWVGLMKIPFIGSTRIGHVKTPQGFEGDSVSSSRAMTFMERSSFNDAFYQNFSTGVWVGNSVLDQRATWAGEIYRQDNDNGLNSPNNGVSLGSGGAFGYSGRITALPIYQNDGRCLLHLGLSYTYRVSERPNATAGNQGELVGPREAEFRARPQMRDAIGDYGGTNGNNATPVGLSGNSKRLVDTGPVAADHNQALGTELFYVRGPFSLQAEYAWAALDNGSTLAGTNLNRALRVGTPIGTQWFNGGYIQASYFLTGENRIYDRRLGREGSTYIAGPNTPFWLTRGENGNITYGSGAWELAVRLNHLNLNSGPIQGGETDAVEAGINWYLNPNLKIQFEYLWQDRYRMKTGVIPGDINGFGVRTQFFF
jgi:phosphate-selective porin OprO/OprP